MISSCPGEFSSQIITQSLRLLCRPRNTAAQRALNLPYSWSRFKTGDEIDREEEGALKDVVVQNEDGQDEVKRVNVVRGVIRYPKDDGTFYELR